MVTVNKDADTLSAAVGLTNEEFTDFGEKILISCEGFVEKLTKKDTSITRLNFLEHLSTNYNETELLLMALTAFEDNLQKVIQFKQALAMEQAEAHAKEEGIDYSTAMTAEEPAIDIAHEELPEAPLEAPDPVV